MPLEVQRTKNIVQVQKVVHHVKTQTDDIQIAPQKCTNCDQLSLTCGRLTYNCKQLKTKNRALEEEVARLKIEIEDLRKEREDKVLNAIGDLKATMSSQYVPANNSSNEKSDKKSFCMDQG